MGKVNIEIKRENYEKNKNNNNVKQQNKLEKIKQIKAQKSKKKKKIIIVLLSIVIIAIIVTGIVFLVQNFPKDWSFSSIQNSQKEENNNENKQEKTKEEEKQRKNAIKVALNKFKELGEDIKEKDLEVLRIQREGKKYYYISSPENTVEVSIETNKIARLNGVIVNN